MDNWRFYKTPQGGAVARDELRALPELARAELVSIMKRRGRRQALLRRENRHIEGPIWELRGSVAGVEYRAFYGKVGDGHGVLLMVHVVQKQRTREVAAVKVARDRYEEWAQRHV